jgi:hypothetical protein
MTHMSENMGSQRGSGNRQSMGSSWSGMGRGTESYGTSGMGSESYGQSGMGSQYGSSMMSQYGARASTSSQGMGSESYGTSNAFDTGRQSQRYGQMGMGRSQSYGMNISQRYGRMGMGRSQSYGLGMNRSQRYGLGMNRSQSYGLGMGRSQRYGQAGMSQMGTSRSQSYGQEARDPYSREFGREPYRVQELRQRYGSTLYPTASQQISSSRQSQSYGQMGMGRSQSYGSGVSSWREPGSVYTGRQSNQSSQRGRSGLGSSSSSFGSGSSSSGW